MLLEPCQGNQTVGAGSTIELTNESDEACEVISKKDGTVYRVNGNQTISIPLISNLIAKGKVQFTVNKAGRNFTVYGLVRNASDSQTGQGGQRRASIVSVEENLRPNATRESFSLENRRRSSLTLSTGGADIDPLVVSTENLINERLGNKDVVVEHPSLPLTPHAKLTRLQNEASKRSKTIFIKRSIEPTMENVRDRLREGALKIRTEPSLYHDIGIRERIWRILDQYNNAWLEEGLMFLENSTEGENVESRKLSLRSRVFEEIFSNEDIVEEQKERRQGAFPENINFVLKMSQHIVTKFLELVLFLDRAKQAEVLRGAAACLFKVSSEAKSSEEVLVQFGTIAFAGEGDITKHLKKLDYVVTHEQSPLDEYDAKISRGDLLSKIKDGVIFAMLAHSFEPRVDVLRQMRIPAKERLHYLLNNEKLLDALASIDVSLLETGRRGKITKYDIADGHKEKTLSFVWKMVLKFGLSTLVDQKVLMEEIKRVAYRNRENETWKRAMDTLAEADTSAVLVGEDVTEYEEEIQRLLLYWVQVIVAGRTDVSLVRDFSSDLSDGTALCVLVNHYHPEVLSLDSVFFARAVDQAPLSANEKVRKERKNFALLNAAADALGEIPIRLNSCSSRNPPTAQLGFACIAFLFSRLLGTSGEVKAARKIQTLWMVKRAQKTKTAESEKKARRLLRERARSKMEDLLASKDGDVLVRTLVFASPRSSAHPPHSESAVDLEPVTRVWETANTVLEKPLVAEVDQNLPNVHGDFRQRKRTVDATERDLIAELEKERLTRLDLEHRIRNIQLNLEHARAAENSSREKLARLELEKEAADRAAMRERREREQAEKQVQREREQRDILAKETIEIQKHMEVQWGQERGATAEHFASEQTRWLELSRRNAELVRQLQDAEMTLETAKKEAEDRVAEYKERETIIDAQLDEVEDERYALQRRIESEIERCVALEREKHELEVRVNELSRLVSSLESQLSTFSKDDDRFEQDFIKLRKEREMQSREDERLRQEQDRIEEEEQRFQRARSDYEKTRIEQEQALRVREDRLERLLTEEREAREAQARELQEDLDEKIHLAQQAEDARLWAEDELAKLEEARQEEEHRFASLQEQIAVAEAARIAEEERLERARRALQEDVVNRRPKEIHANRAEINVMSEKEEDYTFPRRHVRFESQSMPVVPKPTMPGNDATKSRCSQLLSWLQEPRFFRKIEDMVSHDPTWRSLLFNRECLKAIIWALRKCELAEHSELLCLLRSLDVVFQNERFPGSDLTLHLANALMDVLQTYYNKIEPFSLALKTFAQVWHDFKDELMYRVETLVDLLETKTQIQALCGTEDSTYTRNYTLISQTMA